MLNQRKYLYTALTWAAHSDEEHMTFRLLQDPGDPAEMLQGEVK
jgi:hypothetical protein